MNEFLSFFGIFFLLKKKKWFLFGIWTLPFFVLTFYTLDALETFEKLSDKQCFMGTEHWFGEQVQLKTRVMHSKIGLNIGFYCFECQRYLLRKSSTSPSSTIHCYKSQHKDHFTYFYRFYG